MPDSIPLGTSKKPFRNAFRKGYVAIRRLFGGFGLLLCVLLVGLLGDLGCIAGDVLQMKRAASRMSPVVGSRVEGTSSSPSGSDDESQSVAGSVIVVVAVCMMMAHRGRRVVAGRRMVGHWSLVVEFRFARPVGMGAVVFHWIAAQRSDPVVVVVRLGAACGLRLSAIASTSFANFALLGGGAGSSPGSRVLCLDRCGNAKGEKDGERDVLVHVELRRWIPEERMIRPPAPRSNQQACQSWILPVGSDVCRGGAMISERLVPKARTIPDSAEIEVYQRFWRARRASNPCVSSSKGCPGAEAKT